jgi:hypothetical protein
MSKRGKIPNHVIRKKNGFQRSILEGIKNKGKYWQTADGSHMGSKWAQAKMKRSRDVEAGRRGVGIGGCEGRSGFDSQQYHIS